MVHQVFLEVEGASPGFVLADVRYALIERTGSVARRHGAALVAFGFAPDGLRLVLEGPDAAMERILKGVKCGCARAPGGLRLVTAWRDTSDVGQAVSWAHGDAGNDPWTSQRDWTGARQAVWFDVGPLRRALGEPPAIAECTPETPKVALGGLLRVAAAVVGVMPGNRRAFRLFVHLARRLGWGTNSVARALLVSTRRVRQLAAEVEPRLAAAFTWLAGTAVLP